VICFCKNSLIRLMEIILINYAYSVIVVVNADILVFIVHFFSCLGWRSIVGSHKILEAASEEFTWLIGDTLSLFWVIYEKTENFTCRTGKNMSMRSQYFFCIFEPGLGYSIIFQAINCQFCSLFGLTVRCLHRHFIFRGLYVVILCWLIEYVCVIFHFLAL